MDAGGETAAVLHRLGLPLRPRPTPVSLAPYLPLHHFSSKLTISPLHASDEGDDETTPGLISPATEVLGKDDLLAEILGRLPLQPSLILHASIVSKRWGRLAASAAFCRRLRDHHGRPLVLGAFERDGKKLLFIPALDSPDRIPAERFSLQVCADEATNDHWGVLGCRHGRVVIINRTRCQLVVFDPVSGDRCIVAFPPDFDQHAYNANGALIGDEQLRSSAFQLVLVGFSANDGAGVTAARFYSSETGEWGELIAAARPCAVGHLPCTLIGKRLYWWLTERDHGILEFNMETKSLGVITKPSIENIHSCRSRIINGEDGSVGLVVFSYPSLQMWDRKVSDRGVATWVLRKTVDMRGKLALPSSMEAGKSTILGYTEDADAVIISVHTFPWVQNGDVYVFLVQLDLMQCKKLHGSFMENSYHPYANFYAGPTALKLLGRLDSDRDAAVPQA
ncbi:uncharacterized protein [Aegilops tauschii subsp. strangulata]|nr:uncharacterized protein LOC109762866 [Aegilops tauschii subsp. strangulata]